MNNQSRYSPTSVRVLFAALLCLLLPLPGRAAEAEGNSGRWWAGKPAERQVLRGHVPKVLSRLRPVGRLEATRRLNLSIALPLRNEEALTALLQQIYDPASPQFRHYLTMDQFTERFGPTKEDYEAAVADARASGLKITGTYPNRMVVSVNGAVADIEKALHVTMRTYRHPTENRIFYAPDTDPSLDLAVQVLHIEGLDNYVLPYPKYRRRPAGVASKVTANSETGSGWGGGFAGQDFRNAYAPGVTLTGSGQNVGLLEFGGYTPSDITGYISAIGIVTNTTLTNVLIDGASAGSTGDDTEQALDIEMVLSMAPGASQIIVYIGGSAEDILNRIVSDNLVKQIGCSWGWGGVDTAADQIFQEMAAQGQSFYDAVGDSDAFTPGDPNAGAPSNSPYITQVGGTTLTMSGSGAAWSSETVWNWGGGTGGSGGIILDYPIPTWQQGLSMVANQGSTVYHNVPDVAMTADDVDVYSNGAEGGVGGTSCAAPLWAAFTALVNQQAAANGKNPVGFVNPAIYAIGSSSAYASTFHDITTGNNTSPRSPNLFYATTGYDLCTGWGTPAGMPLINALALPSENLQVSFTSFVSAGPAGGPFTSTASSYTLVNSGTAPLSWSASATPSWLTLSASSGTLAASGSTTVTASLNAGANALTVGTSQYITPYSGAVTFTDTGSNYSQSRAVTLDVEAPPPAPTGLTAARGGGLVELSWNASTGATSYNVERSLTSGTGYTTVGAGVTGTSYTDTGLTYGTTYYYVVSAVNAGGTGAYSAQVSGTPANPTSGVYLRFDETGGTTAADSTGGGWNGTLVNGPVFVAGRINNAVSLTGSNSQYVSLPTGVVSSLTNFTVAAWVNLNSITDWVRLFDFGTGTNAYMFLTPAAPGSGTNAYVRFSITASGYGNEQQINSSVALATGTWTHIAVTLSGSLGTLYVNGKSVGTNSVMTLNPSILGSTMNNYIGRSQYSGDPYLDGMVDEFHIYSSALTAAQIAQLASPPAAPTGVAVAAGNAQATLTWNAATGATGYNAKRSITSGSGYATVASVATTSDTDTGLTNGTPYYYVVTTVKGVAESANSLQASATPDPPPSVPTGLTATGSNGMVALSWTAATAATSYNVLRSVTSGTGYTLVASGVTGTSYNDITVTNGVTYYYIVSASNQVGTSAGSAQAGATPVSSASGVYLRFDETSGMTAADSTGDGWNGTLHNGPAFVAGRINNGVSLSGTSQYVSLPTGVVSSLTNFTVAAWVKLNSITDWVRLFDFGTGTNAYMFLTPANGSTGTVRFAITTSGNGNEQQINSSVTLATGTWTHIAVTLSGSLGTLYINGISAGTNSAMTLNPSNLGSTTNNYIGKSEWSGDPYLNAVVDEFHVYSYALSAAQIAQLASPPSAPTGVAVAPGNAQATLTWNAAAGATGYNAKRSITSGSGYATVASVITTSDTDTGLVSGTPYYYVVTTVNGVAESANSSQVSATPVAPPSAPTGLVATGSNAVVALSWNASSGATSYNVLRSVTSGTGYTSVQAGVSGTTYSDTTVTNGTTYYYVVSASNLGGTSANSAQASATPSAAIGGDETLPPAMEMSGSGASTNLAFTVLSSVLGHTYQLQYTSNLVSGSWTNIGSPQAGTGSDLILEVTINPATAPAGFYRILIQRM